MSNGIAAEIAERGFAVVQDLFAADEMGALLEEIGRTGLPHTRAGLRHALRVPKVTTLSRDARLMSIACSVLGEDASAFRATLFDKSPGSNWLVVWHQDTALPLRERRDVAGWGPWSVKDGVEYAHAPAEALARVLALRVHLDDSSADNGPLRVLPGSHRTGVLGDDQIESMAQAITPADCVAPRGSVVAMRPLIVHASSKVASDARRRVLHIEYAASADVGSGLLLAQC